jgi:hypothetical protein
VKISLSPEKVYKLLKKLLTEHDYHGTLLVEIRGSKIKQVKPTEIIADVVKLDNRIK